VLNYTIHNLSFTHIQVKPTYTINTVGYNRTRGCIDMMH